MTDEKKDAGFAVQEESVDTEESATGEKDPASAYDGKKPGVPDKEFDYPVVNFTNFILSLSTSALLHFGEFPDPASGKPQKNLSAAKHAIDTLDIINEKTKGNLDEHENNLIKGVLYELKIRYVKEIG